MDNNNIMNIEPAILVMQHSMKPHLQITVSLLDFLVRVRDNDSTMCIYMYMILLLLLKLLFSVNTHIVGNVFCFYVCN